MSTFQIAVKIIDDLDDLRFVYPTEPTGANFTVAVGTTWSTAFFAKTHRIQ